VPSVLVIDGVKPRVMNDALKYMVRQLRYFKHLTTADRTAITKDIGELTAKVPAPAEQTEIVLETT
jgi:hypothetical protein